MSTHIDIIADLKRRGVRLVAGDEELLWEANRSFWCDGCGGLVPHVHSADKRCIRMVTKPCSGCGESMIWTRTTNGKSMPVDAEPVSRNAVGPKALLFDLVEQPNDSQGRRTNPEARMTRDHEGFVAHWATCSKRDDFKKAGKA